MNSKKINHILCAVRGVPKSRETATRAIDLALEHQARLTFVQVNTVDFLVTVGPTMTSLSTVYKQLNNLSEFAMLVLCDRAQRRGVTDVDHIIRQGKVIKQIRTLISELQPDLLVMGKPVPTKTSSPSLEPGELENFITEVEQMDHIDIVVVEIEFEGP